MTRERSPHVAIDQKTLGAWFRAEREARGRTQAWVAERISRRRQTVADFEAGRNVQLAVVMSALAALGKGLAIVDARVEVEQLADLFHDED